MGDSRNDSCIAPLIGAVEEYRINDEGRDEVFWALGDRIRGQGEAATEDLLGLAAWWLEALDRLSVTRLLGATSASVRELTRAAFGTAHTDKQRLNLLEGLPVFGAGASWTYGRASRPRWTRIEDASRLLVVLACWNPDEFCIGGRQSIYGLWSIQRPVFPGRETLDYLEMVRKLRDLCRDSVPDVTALDIDRGLHILGGKRRMV